MWRLPAAAIAGSLAVGLLAGCGQQATSQPVAGQHGPTPTPRVSARTGRGCQSPRTLRPGAQVTGAQLAAVDFLTSPFGVAVTGTVVSCVVHLGPLHGNQVYTPKQTAMLAISKDGGMTWTTRGAVLPMTGTGPEQIAAVSADRLWAASASGQLFATSDGGLSWQRQLPGLRILSLELADRTVWAAACATSGPSCPVRIEIARAPGWRWQARSVNAAGSSQPPYVDLRLTPLSASGALLLVRASDAPVRLLLTSDGGLAWSAVTLPGTAAAPRPVAISAATGAWLLLSSLGGGMDHARNSVFRSTDGGRSWSAVSADTSAFGPEPVGAPRPAEAAALAAASPLRIWLASTDQIQSSDDGGRTWQTVPGVDLAGAGDFASFDVLNATHAWLLGWLGGLWRTTDGRHWQRT